VAAVLGALGAGLASMAFRRASDEADAAPSYAGGRLEELDELRSTLLGLVDAGDVEEAFEVMEASVAALRLLVPGALNSPELRAAACTLGAAVEAAGVVVQTELAAQEGEESADLERTRQSLGNEAARLLAQVTEAAGT